MFELKSGPEHIKWMYQLIFQRLVGNFSSPNRTAPRLELVDIEVTIHITIIHHTTMHDMATPSTNFIFQLMGMWGPTCHLWGSAAWGHSTQQRTGGGVCGGPDGHGGRVTRVTKTSGCIM
jgi:hypothetical protein